jgi:hypothetical protein
VVARSSSPHEGVRWDVIRSDIRSFFRQLPGLFRDDFSAVMLVIANIFPVVDMLWKGEPVGSILVIYWMQMTIIGFWTCAKLAVISRWRAVLVVPIFLLMYLSIVNLFGIIAGAMLDDQMRGTEWHQNFSLWNYWVPAALFFATHGLSFWENFVGGREYEKIAWDKQMGKPILRAMPMWLAALVGGIVGSTLNAAVIAVLFVLPVKLVLDLLGHFVEHGRLRFDDDYADPLQS